jgi:hypothetical protein
VKKRRKRSRKAKAGRKSAPKSWPLAVNPLDALARALDRFTLDRWLQGGPLFRLPGAQGPFPPAWGKRDTPLALPKPEPKGGKIGREQATRDALLKLNPPVSELDSTETVRQRLISERKFTTSWDTVHRALDRGPRRAKRSK